VQPAIAFPSQTTSQLLGARLYGASSNNAANAQPVDVVQAPKNMLAFVKGRALGKAGQFVHLSFVANAFNIAPSGGLVPLYGQALAIPTGDPFEIWVAPGQTLYALGSTSSALAGAGNDVYVTYQVAYFEPQWPVDISGSGGPSVPSGGGFNPDGGYTGPKARFALR
jgi:hypothetical protein